MPTTSIAILSFLWIALTGLLLGSALLRWWGRGFSPPVRLLLALGVGLPCLAYAILALGLAHALGRQQILILLGVANALGLALGWRAFPDAWATLRRIGRTLVRSRQRVLYWVLVLWALLLLPATLTPPGAQDWDGLAEHLAMAKVWLNEGAVTPLWYDHHSQFPATLQMLYVVGLALGGPIAAKLIHMLFGLMTVAAVGLLARRHFGRNLGATAMAITIGTPLVGWLSIIAYVDLGALFYSVLGMSFFLDWLRPGEDMQTDEGARSAVSPNPAPLPSSSSRLSSAVWAGAWMGLAMAMKMQAVLFSAVLVAGAVYVWWRRRGRGGLPASQVFAFMLVAGLIASPWYVKSWLWTGNPVYPFAYSIFGGKQWSQWQAQHYTYQQKEWGWGDLPPETEYFQLPPVKRFFAGSRRPDRMLLAPFGLTFRPWDYVDKGTWRFGAIVAASIGPLYLAFLPLLFFRRKRPWAWRVIGWSMVPIAAWWLASAQYSRYLLPALAWHAPAAAWAAYEAGRRQVWVRRTVAVGLGLTLAFALGGRLLPDLNAVPLLTGKVSVGDYLTVSFPPYRMLQFLNRLMTPTDKLISYGEPRLFYLDRPYLWGDPGYHRLLEYDRMTSAEDLIAAYRSLGITWVLINAEYFGAGPPEVTHVADLLRAALREGYLIRLPVAWRGQHYLVLKLASSENSEEPTPPKP